MSSPEVFLDPMLKGAVLGLLAVFWTLFLVRLVGLRAFSKMTAFDFVTTVATASLIAQAATSTDWASFLQALAAIAGVFAAQWLLATARLRSEAAARLIKNEPILLVHEGQFLEAALRQTRTSRSNVLEKIRQAGIGQLDRVQSVVLETTGDISVIAGEPLDPALLEGVKYVSDGADRRQGAVIPD